MFKKLFGSQSKKQETIIAPVTGRVVPLEQVPDPTFAEKMLGEGIAIEPAEGVVAAPVDGEIISVFPSKHAIGIRSKQGLEILIHIGLETVNMKGEGFETYVQEGDKVSAGTKLTSFSLELIKQKAVSTIIPVVITNYDIVKQMDAVSEGEVKRAESELLNLVLA
ncbi:PTS glucose transporter subunit IIA [Neobacillus mesonae]|uniref:PTS sugar transporter subunit IIA n=1 Tax=Neobacillus mesonae TaxID=1193713 RepID=UPI002041A32A|nr:PTS glucose transporter subunit IIA [Neobacillus mesonae]MCM3569808.1 PTS glucose transporter subunit IIA [Neobacillus mesonae]